MRACLELASPTKVTITSIDTGAVGFYQKFLARFRDKIEAGYVSKYQGSPPQASFKYTPSASPFKRESKAQKKVSGVLLTNRQSKRDQSKDSGCVIL